MKSVLLVSLFWIQLLASFAQETFSAIELLDYNILYRDYDNPIKVAVTTTKDCQIRLTGTNCTLRRDSIEGYYSVNPGIGKMATLTVRAYCGDSLLYSYRTEYKVSPLPDPVIFWGSCKSGNRASSNSRLLSAMYPPEIPLKAAFTVLNWELFHNGESKGSGKGGDITPASEFLESIREPTALLFCVTVRGPDNVIRKIDAHFNVDPTVPFEDPILIRSGE